MASYYNAKRALTLPYRRVQRHRYRHQPKPFICIMEALNYSKAIINFFEQDGSQRLDSANALNSDSIVVDVGGFDGEWANKIFQQIDCNLFIFEPIDNFARQIKNKFNDTKKVRIFNYGLADKDSQQPIFIQGPGSSLYKSSPSSNDETCDVITLFDIYNRFKILGIDHIDLLKVNIEGAEYDLLDRMHEKNMLRQCNEVRIQFHEWYPRALFRRYKIRKALSKTHKQNWNYPFVWESWIKK